MVVRPGHVGVGGAAPLDGGGRRRCDRHPSLAGPADLAGGRNEHWGPAVFTSDDLGRVLGEEPGGSIAFPPDAGADVEQIWQLQPGPASRPDEVWAGVEPSALFRSDDGGRTFSLVRGLWDHPHRPDWQPGAGGQCLHTVLPHPDRRRPRPGRDVDRWGVRHRGRRRDAGTRPTAGCAPRSSPTRSRSTASACTRWSGTPRTPTCSCCRTTAASTAARTAAPRGRRRSEGLPAIFGFGLTQDAGCRRRLLPLPALGRHEPVPRRRPRGGLPKRRRRRGLERLVSGPAGVRLPHHRPARCVDHGREPTPQASTSARARARCGAARTVAIELEPAGEPPARRALRSRGRPPMTVRVTLELPSVLADVAGGRRTLAVEMDRPEPDRRRPARSRGRRAPAPGATAAHRVRTAAPTRQRLRRRCRRQGCGRHSDDPRTECSGARPSLRRRWLTPRRRASVRSTPGEDG